MIAWLCAVGAGAAAVLVVASGVVKVHRPRVAAAAMQGLPFVLRRPETAIALGCVEVAAGSAWLVVPGLASGAALAGLYTAFAGYTLVASRAGSEPATCGCFGSASARLGRSHLLFNCVAALIVAGAVASGPRHLFASDHIAAELVVGLQLVVIAFLSYLLLTEFSAAFAAYGTKHGTASTHSRSQEGERA